MLTIEDLAARWGVSVAKAKRIAGRRDGPPRVELIQRSTYISWTNVRFREADVAAWEESRLTDLPPAPASLVKTAARPKGPRPAVPDFLGDWSAKGR